MSSRRTFLVLTDPAKRKIEIYFGRRKAMREIADDWRRGSTGEETFLIELVGDETHHATLDVAWAAEIDKPAARSDQGQDAELSPSTLFRREQKTAQPSWPLLSQDNGNRRNSIEIFKVFLHRSDIRRRGFYLLCLAL